MVPGESVGAGGGLGGAAPVLPSVYGGGLGGGIGGKGRITSCVWRAFRSLASRATLGRLDVHVNWAEVGEIIG